jgi:hypothetical protein
VMLVVVSIRRSHTLLNDLKQINYRITKGKDEACIYMLRIYLSIYLFLIIWYYDFFFVTDFGMPPYSVENRVGGAGRMPILPNSHATLSEGCAPHDIQYFTRSALATISFVWSKRLGMGS